MKKYGLIGFPLGHSFSVPYFKEKFSKENLLDSIYEAYPLDQIQKLNKVFDDNPELIGLNVTIPYKEAVIPFLDELEEKAMKIGAVNTIKIKNGKRIGYNTDILGFQNSLLPLIEDSFVQGLILGTGGAAKAVAFVLEELGIPFRYVSSKPSTENINYQDLNENWIKSHTLIIHCSPLGMYPHIDSFPDIPYQYLGEGHILFDLIYNPEETLFLKKGREMGARTKNGLEMLYRQAEASWEIWNT